MTAQNIAPQNPALAQFIVTNAKQAFTEEAIQASIVATIVLLAASITTFIILPWRVRPPEEVEGEITPEMVKSGIVQARRFLVA